MTALPTTCLPTWNVDELPEPKPLGWRNLAGFIGPGIVMMRHSDRRRRMAARSGGHRQIRRRPDVDRHRRDHLAGLLQHRMRPLRPLLRRAGLHRLHAHAPRTRRSGCGVALLFSLVRLIPGLSTNAAVLIVALYLRSPADDWTMLGSSTPSPTSCSVWLCCPCSSAAKSTTCCKR